MGARCTGIVYNVRNDPVAMARPTEHQAPVVVGAHEIAARLGVSREAVDKWRQRYPDFPKPDHQLQMGPAWWWATIAAWARRTGRL